MIEIDGITKRYGDTTAVDAVSMTAQTGTITAIVGTSGSGKTTLLRMINRLVEPSKGEVRINGTPTSAIKPHLLRRRIGYAIQGHGLFPHHSVARNIGAVPQLLGWSPDKIRARVDELLDLFSMAPDEFRDRYPSDLSGGQQQRVGVARALASRPDLLLMDEPFGALDPIIRARAQDDLRRIQRALGSTIMLVTHDMEEAIRLADRIAVMDAGKLVQHGPPADIIATPATPFVAEMVGEADRPLRLLSLIPVTEIAEDGAADGPPLPADATLRDALSACLWTGRSALPVVGASPAHVTLDAIRARVGGHG
ncbi:amino acid ABC transporter ATP-binding protein [Salipiger aestuarii]|uniref:Osmoprotectant transport system ATP-binding protein n=1 Tax=Salipiger aestuarii TaxID=568098 RepID=A0A327YFJ1_9RHOB|nr:ABC transporter ATP-binding protein [Salipiger aestuarii]EIE49596.1 osmoprotectant transport system ATP-binding protein [Citreicella sp. 357]KAA8608885.1 amino acid ABC transporter ATP-binding protein [Salipiger aestuarii]KAA8613189.1 amino acid ABC transporter ATP-binding protein [Salipiger aestuarii]KAB2543059.1 amino acid ABC transporter ATP-binding protein [Salipiger aestuarii]RAK19673.1 osmoprotectant transport system ATP-binding protein [Salipiger aestuarii]